MDLKGLKIDKSDLEHFSITDEKEINTITSFIWKSIMNGNIQNERKIELILLYYLKNKELQT